MESKRCVLITGASSGIGRALAEQFSARGNRLILVSRRREALEALAELLPTQAEVYPCDLSDRTQVPALCRLIHDKKPDVVVNNAGFGIFGDRAQGDVQRHLEMIEVNLKALHLIFQESLAMMERRGGQILNVASAAGLLPAGPHMSAYYATKAYVVSLTEGVACELREKKSAVRVAVLCPGPVRTNFDRVANVRFALPGMTAEACAAAAIRGLEKGKTLIVPDKKLAFALMLSRVLPRSWVIRMASRQQRRKG